MRPQSPTWEPMTTTVRAPAAPRGDSEHHTNPWLILVLVCVAQFMVVLDGTIVNVALPSIQRDLHFSPDGLQWTVNAYVLMFGGFLLLGGRAGDLFGRKRLFLGGLALFTCASLLSGVATSSAMLIAARGLQGLGAAFVSPVALSIVTSTFTDGHRRAKALAVWSAIAVGGGAIGLIVGGALTEYLSWRWNFFVNLPVGIATILVAGRLLPPMRARHAGRGFDLGGAATVTGGLILIVYGIVSANQYGWSAPRIIVPLVVGVGLLGAFVAIERRVADPLVRLGILRKRSLRGADMTMLVVAGGIFAVFFFASLYVQDVLGFSPLRAGLGFVPLMAAIVLAANVARRLVSQIGIKTTALIGMSIAAVGLGLLTMISVNGSYVRDVLPGLIVMGLGLGMTFLPLTLLATHDVSRTDAGLASGLLSASQQVGGALGLAILSTLAASRITGSLAGLGHAPTHLQQAQAEVSGYRAAFWAAAGLMILGVLFLSLVVRRRDIAPEVLATPEAVGVDV